MNEVLRQEKKFLITLEQYYRLSHRFAAVLHEDAHNRGDGYAVRSLYFDSLGNRDLEQKESGVELRRKIRLRIYAPKAATASLEMKQKQGMMQKKRSLRMRREDAERLIEGDYGVLQRYADPFAAECCALMNMHAYRPKAIVEYRRRAFIAKENAIRITFDHHITGTESCFALFSPELVQNPIFDPCMAVLEVKFNGFLLGYIKDLLREIDASEISVSKYCLARATTAHYRF